MSEEKLNQNIETEEGEDANDEKTVADETAETDDEKTVADSDSALTSISTTLSEIANNLLAKIEPVIAPIEDAIQENVIEPVFDAVSDLAEKASETVSQILPETNEEKPQPVSSAENVKFSDAARTSILTKTQPYEVAEIDFKTDLAKLDSGRGSEAEALAKTVDAAELDVLGIEELPILPQTNRARLQVQSPNRIFLYWTIAGNPFATLQKAIGNRAGNYQTALKLINLSTGEEKISISGTEGSWWFDVAANAEYRVEVGFFAGNRPFVKLMSSNVVETPRSNPSSRIDTESDWRVSRVQFARVLDVSGYAHDALPVVFGFGEDGVFDEAATISVLNQLTTNAPATSETFDAEEMRFLLSALAAGVPLAALEDNLSPALGDWVASVLAQNAEALSAENVLTAMSSVFGDDFIADFAELGDVRRIALSPVFGASAIHFPEIALPRIFQRLPERLFPNFPTSSAFRQN